MIKQAIEEAEKAWPGRKIEVKDSEYNTKDKHYIEVGYYDTHVYSTPCWIAWKVFEIIWHDPKNMIAR